MRNPFRKRPAETPQPIPTGSKFPELVNLVADFTPLDGTEDWLAYTKMDGIRCVMIDGRLVSREGGRLPCADHALPALQDIENRAGKPLFLDMEYVARDGTFNSTLADQKRGEGEGIVFIHDGFTYADWLRGGSFDTAEIRHANLAKWCATIDSPFVRLLKPVVIRTNQDVVTLAAHVWSTKQEGLVLKRAASSYQRQRTSDWRKVKKALQATVPILDVLYAKDGRFVGLLVKGPAGRPLKVTSGFKATDASAFALMTAIGRDMSDARARIAWTEAAGSSEPRHCRFLEVAA
jgi:ATP-dependent DNA ligase